MKGNSRISFKLLIKGVLLLSLVFIYTTDEKFNKSMRFFASLRMTYKVILPLMLIIQPFSVILRTLVRRISFLNFIKTTNFSPKVLLLSLVFIYILLNGCSIKEYTAIKNKNPEIYCLKAVNVNYPEPTLRDVLTKSISDGILQSGNKLECSDNTKYFVNADVVNLNFIPLGYSPAQRANVYKVSIDLRLKVEDRHGNVVIDRMIKENTQYVGAGLRSDIEKIYAFEEVGELIKIRTQAVLTKNE